VYYHRQLAALFVLALTCFACTEISLPENQLPKQSTTNETSIPSDALITLERTSCFGTCPIYKLEISADGSVVYEGKENVKTKGRAESQIASEKLKRLLAHFESIDYFSLADYYESGDSCRSYATDNPSALTSLRMNGRSKSVSHYYGCRGTEILERLTELEAAIDEAANSKQWVE
jgi:hypothetical protein